MPLNERDLFVVNPEFFKNLYARVIETAGGTALVYFSDGSSGSEFKERHPKWVPSNQPLAYLAGPMRGYENYNAEEFDAHEECLREMGYLVINPSKVDYDIGFDPRGYGENHDWSSVPFGFKLERAISRCAVGVAMSDVLYLMEGWESSAGARAELSLALWAGIPVIELKRVGEFEFLERAYIPRECDCEPVPHLQQEEPPVADREVSFSGAMRTYVVEFFNFLSRS